MTRLIRLFMVGLLLFFAAARPAMAQSILRDSETELLFKQLSDPLIEAAGLDKNSVRVVLLNDPEVGSLCLTMVAGTPNYAMDKFNALAPTLAQYDKPAVVALLGDDFPVPPEFMAAFRVQGVPVLRSTERGLRALARVSLPADYETMQRA